MREQRLKGEIAVVTGSDSGIGQATAIAFAREGADVAITYLDDREGAEHTRKQVEEAGRKAVVVELDQTKTEDIDRLFQETQSQLGTPTIRLTTLESIRLVSQSKICPTSVGIRL